MATHEKHPRCPGCGKALYKAFDGPWNGAPSPKVKKADPYKFCRNQSCALGGPAGVAAMRSLLDVQQEDAVGSTPNEPPKAEEKQAEAASEPPKRRVLKRKARPARSKPTVATEPEPGSQDSEPVRKARARIREFVVPLMAGKSPVAVGLILAILNQETGNKTAANALIDEFKLDKLFGLQKF